MGQSESTENTTETTSKGVNFHKKIENKKINPFFDYAEVEDSIQPIYEQQDEKAPSLESNGDFNMSADLQEALGNDGFPKGRFGDGDKNSIDSKLSDMLGKNDESEEESEDDDDNRGMFHHDLKNNDNDELSIYTGRAHPIEIQGDCVMHKTLQFKDLSQWQNQYPAIRYEWFIGTDIGTQVTFQIVPASETTSLYLKRDYIGYYIQLVVTREIEKQVQDATLTKGIYDPHVRKIKDAKTGLERQFVPVKSIVIVGPVSLSSEWSYLIMKALAFGSYTCSVKLFDEKLNPNTKDATKISTSVYSEVFGNITVTFRSVVISYEGIITEREIDSSSMLSWNWIKSLLGFDINASEQDIKKKLGSEELNAQLKLKYLNPQLSAFDTVINLYTVDYSSNAWKEFIMIRFQLLDNEQRDLCFYHILSFKAARAAKLASQKFWAEKLKLGEYDLVNNIIQNYLLILTSTANENLHL